jgi:hypothetical protein
MAGSHSGCHGQPATVTVTVLASAPAGRDSSGPTAAPSELLLRPAASDSESLSRRLRLSARAAAADSESAAPPGRHHCDRSTGRARETMISHTESPSQVRVRRGRRGAPARE